VIQRYVLDSGSHVVRVELILDWHETETLLKLHLRTGYRGTHVRCGTPFGSILRPQLPGTLAAEAMWEIPASRWIAGTDDSGRQGMFIVTEAKFGFSCRDGDWGVSLVRSPRVTGFEEHAAAYPSGLSRLTPASIYADQGEHRISLAIGAYQVGALREQHPAALAEVLFTPPLRYVGPPRTTPFRGLSHGQSLLPSWARPLGEDWILRLHEVNGERGAASIELAPGWSAQPVDLRERPRGPVLANGRIEFRPYEIVSLRVSRLRKAVEEGVASSLWSGFHREDFQVDGRACIVVQPRVALPSRPWIWRTEFFGAFPSVDLALLRMGFHLAYMDVQDMYGAPVALDHMDEFHSWLIRDHRLGRKPVLEGFSRGALHALNWAARRADAVACLYLDAPVCDFRSWPAGRGRGSGSREDWERLKQVYGFTEEQALESAPIPLDNLQALAAARVPIIAVYGTADEALPPEENVLLLERRYKEIGGEIMLIAKMNVGHHPHSLADPTAIVNFVLSKTL
jgi:pimeloyl-ACP methyl ester carboxylesterase